MKAQRRATEGSIAQERLHRISIPIVEANARLLASATHEEILRIEAEIRHWGETSLRAEYKGFCGDRPGFEGFEARVWLGRGSNGRLTAATIPEAFKRAVRRILIRVSGR